MGKDPTGAGAWHSNLTRQIVVFVSPPARMNEVCPGMKSSTVVGQPFGTPAIPIAIAIRSCQGLRLEISTVTNMNRPVVSDKLIAAGPLMDTLVLATS